MYYVGAFLIEIFILFFLSKRIHKNLVTMVMSLTHSKKLTAYGLAIIFFPGTLIHEMSHFLTSLLLLVPVGEVTLFPKIEVDSIKLGSVAIAKTDPVRRFFIGVAPIIFGFSIIFILIYFVSVNRLIDARVGYILAVYLIFEVGNTMFMSKKDLDGALQLFIILGILALILYLFGFSLSLSWLINLMGINDFQLFKLAFKFSLIPIAIDFLVLGILGISK